MDAAHFLPQSRPRRTKGRFNQPCRSRAGLIADGPVAHGIRALLIVAHGKLSKRAKAAWTWWRLPPPPVRNTAFSDLIEAKKCAVAYPGRNEAPAFSDELCEETLQRSSRPKRTGRWMVGSFYRRTRTDDEGAKVQRAEIRFDGIAGCLRTPAGGSSRQNIMIVKGMP